MIFFAQHDQMDCGPACLAMVASYYGKNFGLQYLRDKSFITREGVSLLGISEASKKIGFKEIAAKLKIEELDTDLFPCIIHWNQNHFVVLIKISKNFFTGKKIYKIADPGHGLLSLTEEKFKKSWLSHEDKGVALFMEPTEEFYNQTPPQEEKLSIKYLLKYLRPHQAQMGWMIFLLTLGTLSTLVLSLIHI